MCPRGPAQKDIRQGQEKQKLHWGQTVPETEKHIHGILSIRTASRMFTDGWMKVHLIKGGREWQKD